MPAVPKQESYPDFVIDEADQERWDLAHAIAERISEDNEPSGHPNSQFVWWFARQVYHSNLETGTLEEDDSETVEEAEREVVVIGSHDKAWSMWQRLEAEKPGPDVDPEVHWAHVGKVCDLFDELFGNPDDVHLGEHEGRVPKPGDGLTHLEEAFTNVMRGPYKADLHPRDRLGKWAAKLNGLRSFAKAQHLRVKQDLAARVGAARLKGDVKRSTLKGGALHGDVSKVAANDPAARLRAHAQEERNRSGVRGLRQQAVKAHTITKGTALSSIAAVYADENVAHKLGPAHESLKDAFSAQELMDRVKDAPEVARVNSDLAHEAAQYAVDHREEISAVMSTVKHLAAAAARAKGLAAADDTEVLGIPVVLDEYADEPVLVELTDEDFEIAEFALAGVGA